MNGVEKVIPNGRSALRVISIEPQKRNCHHSLKGGQFEVADWRSRSDANGKAGRVTAHSKVARRSENLSPSIKTYKLNCKASRTNGNKIGGESKGSEKGAFPCYTMVVKRVLQTATRSRMQT